MKKSLLSLIIIVFLIITLGFFLHYNFIKKTSEITINNQTITVDLAITPLDQQTGLSFKKNLAENKGMLFIYPDKQIRKFWMKDMNFPLDILWLSDDKIISIDKNLPAAGDLPKVTYSSPVPVNYVLEILGGTSDKFNFKSGDTVKYNL